MENYFIRFSVKNKALLDPFSVLEKASKNFTGMRREHAHLLWECEQPFRSYFPSAEVWLLCDCLGFQHPKEELLGKENGNGARTNIALAHFRHPRWIKAQGEFHTPWFASLTSEMVSFLLDKFLDQGWETRKLK